MATTKVTTAIDRVTPKTPGALRVVFTKNAGNEDALNIADLDPNDYITKQMFEDNIPIVALSTPLPYAAGTALPITLSSFQSDYSDYGNYPGIEVMINSGDNKGLIITSQASVNRGTVTPPDTVTIYADDDGTGVTANDILIIIKP